MKNNGAAEVASDLFGDWLAATTKARNYEAWARGERPDRLYLPTAAQTEYEELEAISVGGYGEIVVTAVSQQQYVENHRSTDSTDPSEVFRRVWRPNGMPARQLAIHRGANATGQAFLSTLPGTIPGTDQRVPILRGHSSTRTVAWFDQDSDEFPTYVMEGEIEEYADGKRYRFQLIDDEKIYHIVSDSPGTKDSFQVAGVEIHDCGIPPFHRFAPRLDLEGRAIGEIQRIIPTLKRLDQDILDRLIVQRFGAWRVKYATGLTKPETQAEEQAAKLMLSISDILVSSGDKTSFGTLEPTPLDGFIKAREADERTLAARTQVPAYQLSGTVDNVSADGLAMMQNGLAMHAEEIRTSFGQSYDQAMRTCAYMLHEWYPTEGFLDIALDYETTTIWRDTEIRSLAHAADALGKLSDQLGIPPEVLWRRIPGWQKADDELARGILKENGMLGELVGMFRDAEQAAGGEQGGDAAGAGTEE